MSTPEGRVKGRITKLLDSFGGDIYYEMPVPSGFGKSGLDYTGCLKTSNGGKFFAIEAKAPGKGPTARQVSRMEQMAAAGAYVFVVSCDKDLGELRAWIEMHIGKPSA